MIIQCGKKGIDKLNEALKSCSNDDSADEQKVIATNSWLFKHEIGHAFGKHVKNSINFKVLAPFAVQSFVSVAKKSLGIYGVSKTIPGFIGVLLGSIISKLSIGYGSYCLYKQYQERQADLYACEHANIEELIAGRDYFLEHLDDCINCYFYNKPTIVKRIKLKKNHFVINSCLKGMHFINDKYHPYPGDRADAIDRVLQEFDKNK